MTREQTMFIRILADHIHGRPSVPENFDLDWEKLAEYAEEQVLTGMTYIQLKNFFKEHPDIVPEIQKRLRKGFYTDAYLYANRKAELKVIADECRDTPLILMKGSVVQSSYPVPVLRSMGDIDVIIHPEHRQKTDEAMLKQGYRKMVDNHAVWTYEKESIQFEIHDHMFYEYLANDVDYREYFDQVWDHVRLAEGTENIYVPDEDFHFLYLITHMAKHIINKGMGFRSFMDLAFVVQKSGKQMDWKWIQEELGKLKLLDFTKTCFAFLKIWFDVPAPFETGALEPGFYSEVTEKMFIDGIFGLKNQQNKAAHSAKEIKRSKDSYWLTAVRLTIRRLFPSYRDMQLVPWYRFVDGRPWLLPAAWVYRWGYAARHKLQWSRDLLLEPYRKRKDIEKRKKMIGGWGL